MIRQPLQFGIGKLFWLTAGIAAFAGVGTQCNFDSCCDCGDNTALRSVLGLQTGPIRLAVEKSRQPTFSLREFNESEYGYMALQHLADGIPAGPNALLVNVRPFAIGEQDKTLLMVSTRSYSYRRHPWFKKRDQAHPACYSDGTTALLSPEEYAKLDRTPFIPLDVFLSQLTEEADAERNQSGDSANIAQ